MSYHARNKGGLKKVYSNTALSDGIDCNPSPGKTT